MDCGTTLVKYILFLFNALMSILGILAIVYGVLVLETIPLNSRNELPQQAAVPVSLIIIGSIVLFIAFLGCCGAIRENVCMTMCYSVIMLVLLIFQLVSVIFVWTNNEKISSGMASLVEDAWERSQGDAVIFEAIQKTFKCCGVNGASDYALKLRLPTESCCESGSVCTPLNYYGGCKNKFSEFMSGSTDNAKYFGLGLIVIEVVGFIFACCLANNIRNYKRRNAY